jgi:hypothetical protein
VPFPTRPSLPSAIACSCAQLVRLTAGPSPCLVGGGLLLGLVSERTKAALAVAKARGKKLGSPITTETVGKARAARSAYAAKANDTTRAVIRDTSNPLRA